jgi:hypothetical protein
LLVLAEIISSTLKMEAICSSETSVATQQTTRRHIPEDDTPQATNNLNRAEDHCVTGMYENIYTTHLTVRPYKCTLQAGGRRVGPLSDPEPTTVLTGIFMENKHKRENVREEGVVER